MGCDYYIITYLIVKYMSTKNQTETEYIPLQKRKGYIDDDLTLDFQTLSEYLEELNEKSPITIYYDKNKWVCKEYSVPYYVELIEQNCKDLVQIISVYRQNIYEKR